MATNWQEIKQKLDKRRAITSDMRNEVLWLVDNLHDPEDFDLDEFARADTAQIEDVLDMLDTASVAILIQYLAQSSKYQQGYRAGISAAIESLNNL